MHRGHIQLVASYERGEEIPDNRHDRILLIQQFLCCLHAPDQHAADCPPQLVFLMTRISGLLLQSAQKCRRFERSLLSKLWRHQVAA